MKVKDVLEFLGGIKLCFFLLAVVLILVIMGQTVEQREWDLLDKTPVRIMLGCAGITTTAQLFIWLIQFGSRNKPEPEAVPEKDVDSVLANIRQAREWVTNAELEFDAAKGTLGMAHDALDEAELDHKRERHTNEG